MTTTDKIATAHQSRTAHMTKTIDRQAIDLHAATSTSLCGRARDERGIALLSVLGVLAIMLVLASLMATSSQTEAKLSGVTQQTALAFAAADAGLEFALADVNNWTQLGTRCTDLKTAGLAMDGDVCVKFNRMSAPPVAVKVSALKFSAFYFDVTSTGTALAGASSSVAMEAARLGPAQ
jgi:Tfp pilus assembly protein PilX